MDITPSPEETSQSQLLANRISQEIKAQGGQISFAKYMEMALYTPGLGYYAAGKTKLGTAGDFTTAPELSPLFGQTIVETILPIFAALRETAAPLQILEFGAGSGALAESVLDGLKIAGISIDSYNILDLSADLITRQKERLKGRSEKITWLNELPTNFVGIILANEVIDAMPIDMVTLRNGRWYYRDVALDASSTETIRFTFCDGKQIDPALLPEVLQSPQLPPLPDGYITETHLNAQAWIRTLAKCLKQGALLTFDYGFPSHEYYHPQRTQGTFMGHYRHHAIQDPFFYPGICDLTAHVEWTSLANTAHDTGFTLLGYTNQASYLLDAGISQLTLTIADPSDAIKFMPLSNALQKLLSEAEMGELFKVMCLGMDLPFTEGELPGFRGRPRAL